MKVAIYGRVSTRKQGEHNLETQIAAVMKFCERENHQIVDVYSEIVSGIKDKRAEFERLKRDAKQHNFEVVVVLKFDRFSRSLKELLTSVEFLEENGISFISVNDKIDTHSPSGRLLFHIMGALSEFETSLIKERTQSGIERAKAEGKVCHRPRKEVNIEKLKERLKQGVPLTEIAASQHVSYGTLRNKIKEAGLTTKVIREVVKR